MNDDIFDKPSEAEIDKIHEVDLKEKMETFYIDYAMSVIASRALPDVRDGLKPVQRRTLYDMHRCQYVLVADAQNHGEDMGLKI